MTAAVTSGPARQPLPTSSMPQTSCEWAHAFDSKLFFLKVGVSFILNWAHDSI
jgi:hypothetical protein